jgi:hypothetical protein
VSGVIVGLLLGWVTLEASFRARRQFAAWFRWKMGFEVKEGDQAQVGIRASESAVWDAEENGYTTPKRDAQVSIDFIHVSLQELTAPDFRFFTPLRSRHISRASISRHHEAPLKQGRSQHCSDGSHPIAQNAAKGA